MKKKYIEPEIKVIAITEKLSLLQASDLSINSGGGGAHHGNAKPHGGLFDIDFEDNEPNNSNSNSLWN